MSVLATLEAMRRRELLPLAQENAAIDAVVELVRADREREAAVKARCDALKREDFCQAQMRIFAADKRRVLALIPFADVPS